MNPYTIELSNKTVLITGGYGFLGKSIVLGLLHNEANVYVLGRDQKKYEDCFQEYLSNKRLHFFPCDVASTKSIQIAFREINQIQPIDVLINNAVYLKGQSPETMTDEDWAFGIDGTLNSCFRCIREIIPYFKAKKSGKIINVSSMYGVVAPQFDAYTEHPEFLNPPHYGASKAGVIQLTKYYASYLGPLNIQVNAVTPGPFPSVKVQESEKFIARLESKTCLNRIGTPDDLAGAFVFLSSNASNFITGHNLVVDGGWSIK